jgi:dienelactone hydrolase
MATTHLSDQLAALAWLQARGDVQPTRIAVGGNSFGGVQALLGGAAAPYCAVAAASVASESWADAPPLQALLLQAAREARAPVLLFQARNDHDLAPHEALRQEMQRAGRSVALRLYPAAGQNAQQGHAFAYQGSSVWFADVISFLQRHCP